MFRQHATSAQGTVTQAQAQAQAMKKPTSRFIVVCGATDLDESWLFGNFVGFCRVLGRLGVTGKFLNIFPIGEFFDRGEFQNIKFGTEGQTNSAIEIYTKYEYEHKQPFFTQYKDGKLLHKDTLSLINKATTISEPGDSFTVVLIGHGNNDGISLGSSTVKKDVLVDLIGKFKQGVQVNIVVQSCRSGCFVDAIQATNQKSRRYVHTSAKADQKSYPNIVSPSGRFRNSVFSGAFLKHLGFAYDKANNAWTLEGHIMAVRRDTKYPRNPEHSSDPQDYISDLNLLTKFVEVLYADYVDRSFNHPHAARRILTPTTQDTQGTPEQQGSPYPEPPFVPSEELSSTSDVLEAEISLVGSVMCENDIAIATMGSIAKRARGMNNIDDKSYGKRLAAQLAKFKWRFRIQESIFLAFQGLEEKGLISMEECFKYPIDWHQNSATVSGLFNALRRFEIAEECTSITSTMGLFDDPVTWLAIAIARTCPDVQEAFEFLRESWTLGTFNQEEFKEMGQIKVQVNPKEMACDVQTSTPQIGFWLPQNIKGQNDMYFWACNVRNRYEAMKRAYEKCYGRGTWGYDVIEPTVMEWIG